MRLSPNKIAYLADRILQMFQESGKIHLAGTPDLVARTIEDVIFNNLRAEDEIDQEVEALIDCHKGEIQTLEMDMGALRMKFKRELAKKRGFTL